MKCPNCGEQLNKRDIIKVNVKGFDNVDVAYDAICPFCGSEIGKMFWGDFTLYGEVTEDEASVTATDADTYTNSDESPSQRNDDFSFNDLWEPRLDQDTQDNELNGSFSSSEMPVRQGQSAQTQTHGYVCPHCGKPLPHDLSRLKGVGYSTTYKIKDRREGQDRRVKQIDWPYPERRQGDRRKSKKTRGERNGTKFKDRRRSQKPILYERRRERR